MVTYMIYGRETGANGTKHFQGYVQFKNRHRFEALKKLVPKAHWEKAKGSHCKTSSIAVRMETSLKLETARRDQKKRTRPF